MTGRRKTERWPLAGRPITRILVRLGGVAMSVVLVANVANVANVADAQTASTITAPLPEVSAPWPTSAPDETLPPPAPPTTQAPATTEAPTTTALAPTTTSVPVRPDLADPTLGPVCGRPGPCRLVAYYGNPLARGMGILGRTDPPSMLASLAARTAQWQAADPATTTKCALELIAITVQAAPGKSGLYRARMDHKLIERVLGWARGAGCIVLLDVQVGWSTVASEVAYLAKWLEQPDVHLALDPEWDMPLGVAPGSQIGTMDADDINGAIAVISKIVADRGLPPKVLVVHRFRSFMVTRPEAIVPTPQVRLVVNMDGFGTPARKRDSYRVAKAGMPTALTGYKLFTLLDTPMLTPAEVLKLSPPPVFMNYQ